MAYSLALSPCAKQPVIVTLWPAPDLPRAMPSCVRPTSRTPQAEIPNSLRSMVYLRWYDSTGAGSDVSCALRAIQAALRDVSHRRFLKQRDAMANLIGGERCYAM